MVAKAYAKYLRISPRKVKIVCDMIRGQDVKTARARRIERFLTADAGGLNLLFA